MSLPTGETNGSTSDLAFWLLSPAGRGARAQRGGEGKLTIIKRCPEGATDPGSAQQAALAIVGIRRFAWFFAETPPAY